MSVLFVVLPLALVIVAVAVGAFVWASRRGQFDDLDTPAVRALHDDAPGADDVRARSGGRAP
ncbi:MAG: cbb3-type cytochrome oxidase assembly protein CcoS [Gemmatirosa sp.]